VEPAADPPQHSALLGDCDAVIVQFAHMPAVRDAIQQREELQAQLEAAEERDAYQLVIMLGDKLDALQETIKMLPLSEDDYRSLEDRHAALLLKVSCECKALSKARNRTALEPLAVKLDQLKALGFHVIPVSGSQECCDSPASAVRSDVSGRNGQPTDTIATYNSNGVPIANVEQQSDLAAASVRLMLRGEFRSVDTGSGVAHTYRCLIKCANHATNVGPSETDVDRLRREHAMYLKVQEKATTLGTGCVRCYSIDTAGRYIVLEDHGIDLRALLNADLSYSEVLMERIIGAVHALHAANIMHGDIKPANLLVKSDLHHLCVVKLCDLECAKKVGELCDAATLGTMHYLAPEVRLAAASATGNLPASTAVDMFALGLVLWQVMKRSPTAALDCDSEDRLMQLYSNQTELNAHLGYSTRHSAVMERVTCLASAHRANTAKLIKHLHKQDLSLLHQENTSLKSTVLSTLIAMDRKLDQQHDEVVSRLEALADGVSALCVRAEAAAEALQRAEGMGAASQEQLASLIEVLTAALPTADSDATTECSDASAVRDVAESLAMHGNHLRRAAHGDLSSTQLQRMKKEIIDEFSRLAKGMQQAAYEQLRRAEEAQTQRLQQLLGRSREAAVADLEAAMEALRVQQSQAQSGASTAVTERLQQLQASLDAVRAAQDADSYKLHEVPLLVEVVATQPKRTLSDGLKRCLYEVHRLHFCCPACGTRAASGPNKQGYELRSTRDWVQQAARVLKVTLFALQVASLVTPLPLPRLAELGELLPVSDAKAVTEALDFVREQVEGNVVATIGEVRAALENQLTPAQLQALSVTREHVSSVRALLLKAGDSIPPKHSGLAPVVSAGTRECAWVCAGCSDTYRERGNACLAVKISLD
jgi:hypothetical protein